MESRTLESKENKEVILVKKGIFYYIFKGILFPFILLYKLGKYGFGYIKEYYLLVQDIKQNKAKWKRLNTLMSIKPNDEEIV